MSTDPTASRLADDIGRLAAGRTAPLVVALDGRSGAGKSTLAAAVQALLPSCAVIGGDDFYSGGSAQDWDSRSAAEKAAGCMDWRRQRPVLRALAAGTAASWHAYDWEAFDGRRVVEATTCDPADVVILEGAYSARPELADLLDLRVLLHTPTGVRLARLDRREGTAYRFDWFGRWNEAEEYYFGEIVPPDSFDLVV